MTETPIYYTIVYIIVYLIFIFCIYVTNLHSPYQYFSKYWNVQPWNLIIHFYYLLFLLHCWPDLSSSSSIIFIPVLQAPSRRSSSDHPSSGTPGTVWYSSFHIKYSFRIPQEMAKGKCKIKFILYNFLHRPNLYYFRNCHFSQKKLLRSRDKKMFLYSKFWMPPAR